MNPDTLERGEPVMECTKCGRCMDNCPTGAIEYRLLGTRDGIRPVFVSLAVVFNILITSSFILAFVHYLITGKIRFF
jgi:ferredoxin